MENSNYTPPIAYNEPIKEYLKGSKDREKLVASIAELKANPFEVPLWIGGNAVKTKIQKNITPPYDHKTVLGTYHFGDKKHVEQAIDAALKAKDAWENMSFQNRASIFLKAAELVSTKYREILNAATLMGQGKNIYQAEIDCICELADFLRFNVQYAHQIYQQQPASSKGIHNHVEYRALEGFVLAISPFNFTAIAGNLCCAPALMGNVVVWKPSENQIYSAYFLIKILEEAGLPKGVINMVVADGQVVGDVVFKHSDFAGLHYTGSTHVFKSLWRTIGENINLYKSYPKIVGETGGKDFILAHTSANIPALVTAIVRGGFEYQGQKCSAASRIYLPKSSWKAVEKLLFKQLKEIKMGSPEDFKNFVNAVINETAFDKITHYIDLAKKSKKAEIIFGGKSDKSKGYFIEPTVILTSDPHFVTMEEEIFGPVVTLYLYEDADYKKIIKTIDNTSIYALTGAVFSDDKEALDYAVKNLKHAAGNFYINDKPTGGVVNQQPFGGARASGTNDKAGSALNLYRWISPRTIKENFTPPEDYSYPFMK